jgi:stearoyl-CoA desaturase (delta-9 desaturase)
LTQSQNPSAANGAERRPLDVGVHAQMSTRLRVANLIAITLPVVGVVTAMAFLWGSGFSWVHLGMLLGMYVLTAFGVTVGFHRLLTHRSFETNAAVKFILAVLGSMAVEGPVLRWVATHRCHHQHSDGQEDPHSPHGQGSGLCNMLRGLWHAHMGWLFKRDIPHVGRYVADFKKDRLVRLVHRLFPLWVLIGLLIPTALAGVLTGTWMGAFLGFVWGGLARVFFVHHVTWSVNSVCHVWGKQPFRCHDQSRNNALLGILTLGEGWHNNHHAFPTSARHGLRWWEFDASYLLIRVLAVLGLAWNVKVPGAERVAAKRSA